MNLIKLFTKSLIIFSIMLLAACNNNENQDTENQTENPNNTEVIDSSKNENTNTPPHDTVKLDVDNVKFGPAGEMFRVSMNDLMDGYMSITYSLCFADPIGVKVGTRVFKDMLSKTDPSSISGEMRTYWDNYTLKLSSAISKIEASDDIEAQRKAYAELSELMTVAVKNYGLKDKTVKKYSCREASGVEGASWYFEDSPSYTLMNPYLGKDATDCLEPVETIEGTP